MNGGVGGGENGVDGHGAGSRDGDPRLADGGAQGGGGGDGIDVDLRYLQGAGQSGQDVVDPVTGHQQPAVAFVQLRDLQFGSDGRPPGGVGVIFRAEIDGLVRAFELVDAAAGAAVGVVQGDLDRIPRHQVLVPVVGVGGGVDPFRPDAGGIGQVHSFRDESVGQGVQNILVAVRVICFLVGGFSLIVVDSGLGGIVQIVGGQAQ